MKVSLEAVIGFVSRTQPGTWPYCRACAGAAEGGGRSVQQRRQFEISATIGALRSLRIAADETQEKEVE